jgi:hypothetical protein
MPVLRLNTNNEATMITYEWDIEATDEHGDIQDHNHRDKLAQHGKDDIFNAAHGLNHTELVLVKDVFDSEDDLAYREWAYIKDGVMPDVFDKGSKVPKKHKAEFDKVKASWVY